MYITKGIFFYDYHRKCQPKMCLSWILVLTLLMCIICILMKNL